MDTRRGFLAKLLTATGLIGIADIFAGAATVKSDKPAVSKVAPLPDAGMSSPCPTVDLKDTVLRQENMDSGMMNQMDWLVFCSGRDPLHLPVTERIVPGKMDGRRTSVPFPR